jgi:hypothetical protein
MLFRLGASGGIIDGSGKGEAVPRFSDSIEISRPPDKVWQALGEPERWF